MVSHTHRAIIRVLSPGLRLEYFVGNSITSTGFATQYKVKDGGHKDDIIITIMMSLAYPLYNGAVKMQKFARIALGNVGEKERGNDAFC